MATQLDVVTQLAGLLGGSRTTQTADTSALRNVLAQLQAQDPAAGVASLFQKATGQIPGIQTALGNAMGARRSNNGGIEAALQKLLQDTTLAAQGQIATQQQQNLATQANVAGNIAQASKTTQQKANLGDFAKNLLLLQGLSKGKKALMGEDDDILGGAVKALAGLFGGDQVSTAIGPDATSGLSLAGDSSLGGDILRGSGLDFNMAPNASFDLNSLLGSAAPTFSLDNIDLGFDAGSLGNAAGVDFGGGGLLDELTSYGVFADGGLVGRDGKVPAFADGGSVTLNAAGGRRSSAPTVRLDAINRTNAQNLAAATAAPSNSVSLGDLLGGSGGTGPSTSNVADPTNGAFANALRDALGPVSLANTVSGQLGGPHVPGLGGIASLASAETNEQALRAAGVLGITALLGPVAGLLASAALPSADLSERQAINALNAANPAAAYNAALPTDADIDVTDVAPSDFGGAGGDTGGFGANNDAGSSGFGGDSVGGFGGTQFAADGGKIKGPGTGVSDSIPAMLSNGEYVISKDVVDAVGVEFFDALQASLHTPAATQRAR